MKLMLISNNGDDVLPMVKNGDEVLGNLEAELEINPEDETHVIVAKTAGFIMSELVEEEITAYIFLEDGIINRV